MLTAMTDGRKINAATKAFRKQLATAAGKPVRHMVGFPSGSGLANVWVLRRHGFFACQFVDGDQQNRCWNGFGLVMPEEARILPLVVEINVPWEGVDRRIGGVFLEGLQGEVYVAHRGKIGGGRKGVGKSAFWRRYRKQAPRDFADEPVVLLGKLGSRKLLGAIATFVHTVAEIKREATAGAEPTRPDDPGFTPEFEGMKLWSIDKRIEVLTVV